MAVTKTEFLETMQLSLEGRISPGEAAKLLTDYNAYFETACREGKSEEETAAALGNPVAICRAFLTPDETKPLPILAPMGRRLGAYAIDVVVYLSVRMLLLLLAGFLSGSESALSLLVQVTPLMLMSSLMGGGLIPFFSVWLSHGYTLGKWLLGMKIVQEDGSAIGTGCAFLREFVAKGMFAFIGAGIVPMLSLILACGKGPQCTVEDKLAGTLVIRVP